MTLDQSVVSYLLVNTLMMGDCGVYDLFWWCILEKILELKDNPSIQIYYYLKMINLGRYVHGKSNQKFAKES